MVYTLFTQSYVLVNLTCFLKLKNQSQQTLRFLECSKDVRAVGTVDNSIFGQSCQIFQQLVGIFKIVPSPSHKMLWAWRGKGSIQTQVVVVDIWVALAGHRCQVEGRHWTYWNLGQSWERDYCQKKNFWRPLICQGLNLVCIWGWPAKEEEMQLVGNQQDGKRKANCLDMDLIDFSLQIFKDTLGIKFFNQTLVRILLKINQQSITMRS